MRKYIFISIMVVSLIPAMSALILYKPAEEVKSQPDVVLEDIEILKEDINIEDEIFMQEVSVLTGDMGVVMPLEEYIVGVVLGEMPANFEQQALQAQAIVARTFTCRRIDDPKHNLGDICTDSSCCQAYISPQEYLQMGGKQSDIQKIQLAVIETNGEVLCYNGALIEATYFSCSGGRTEDAEEVWGADVPYLQSVESPGEEGAIHYTDTVSFATSEFCRKLDLDVISYIQIGDISYTNGGGVRSLKINGQEFSGIQLRQKLGLRSTAFAITAVGSSVTITTKGFGHRVGMSQYGADAMALSGSTCYEILSHYYPGTNVDNIGDMGYNVSNC